jgi:hypothetical protein
MVIALSRNTAAPILRPRLDVGLSFDSMPALPTILNVALIFSQVTNGPNKLEYLYLESLTILVKCNTLAY